MAHLKDNIEYPAHIFIDPEGQKKLGGAGIAG
jgi:hypothetical protein